MNSLAYLGFSCIKDIERMTLNEYQLRMEAYQLQKVDRQEELALQAWFNQSVKATKGKGKHQKPYYTKFTELYNAEEQKDKVRQMFEPDYTPQTQKVTHKSRQKILYERLREYDRIHNQKGG